MAMIGPIVGGAEALGPAIPIGFGAAMKWLVDQGNASGSCPWCGEPHEEGTSKGRRTSTRGRSRVRLPITKKKRRVSAYQKEFGRQLKKLKRAHPRTPVQRLMKRAHSATKRARRGR